MNRAVAVVLSLLLAIPLHMVARSAYAQPQPSGRAARVAQPFRDAKAAWRRLGRATRLTIVGTVLGGTIASGPLYQHERARSLTSELAFSERSQVERDAAAAGKPVGVYQTYLMGTNDLVMKVLEASNLSQEKLRLGSDANKLAKELDIKLRLDPHRYTLPGLFKELPGLAKSGRASLGLDEPTAAIKPVLRELEEAWSESHHDNYHTETRTSTDSNGKTQTHTEQVYDNTDHRYTYDTQHGEAASLGLDDALSGNSFTPLSLETTSRTNADGEYAADTSRGRGVDGNGRLTKAELLDVANTWKTGSTYHQNIGRLEELWTRVLKADAAAWRADKGTARSRFYTNTLRGSSDAGPKEFRTARQALADSREFVQRSEEILGGLEYTEKNLPKLERMINELVEQELHHQGVGKTDSKKLASEILSVTREMYRLNFKKGVDTREFRGGLFIMWVMIAMAAGGGSGRGAAALMERIQRRRAGK